jgi:hypothetical protein
MVKTYTNGKHSSNQTFLWVVIRKTWRKFILANRVLDWGQMVSENEPEGCKKKVWMNFFHNRMTLMLNLSQFLSVKIGICFFVTWRYHLLFTADFEYEFTESLFQFMCEKFWMAFISPDICSFAAVLTA